MITLITGTPGAGKTLYAVSSELSKYADRPLFIDGIPELLVPHLPFPDSGLADWQNWAPEGAVIVVDEVQRYWRPRAPSAKVPDDIAELERHRHKGIDFVIITQHPTLIDGNVRRLVGRHLHVRRVFGWARSVVYEWDSCNDPKSVRNAISRTWKYPKNAFKLYKSSVQHNARGQRVPIALLMAIAAIVALPAIGYTLYGRFSERFGPATAPTSPAVAGAGATAPAGDVGAGAGVPDLASPVAFVPRVLGRPESAPAYADAARVTEFPRVAGCISSKKSCRCYTQQGTRVEMLDVQCRDLALNPSFDPYKPRDERSHPRQVDAHAGGADSPQVLSMATGI